MGHFMRLAAAGPSTAGPSTAGLSLSLCVRVCVCVKMNEIFL